MKLIKRLFFSLVLLLKTGKTKRHLARIYGQLCSLDMNDSHDFAGVGRLKAGGCTVDFTPFQGNRIIINEMDGDLIVCEEKFIPGAFLMDRPKALISDKGTYLYEDVFHASKRVGRTEWIQRLERLHDYLTVNQIYEKVWRAQKDRLMYS